jgi:hypothetical protein
VTEYCAYRFPEGWECRSRFDEHVHQPLPCATGKPERHHDYVAPEPHVHVYDRCTCGDRREERHA